MMWYGPDSRRVTQSSPFLYQPLESRACSHNGLIALGTGGNAANFNPCAAFKKGQVVLGFGWQLIVRTDTKGRRVPARNAFVDRLDGLHLGHRGRHILQLAFSRAVSYAHRNILER